MDTNLHIGTGLDLKFKPDSLVRTPSWFASFVRCPQVWQVSCGIIPSISIPSAVIVSLCPSTSGIYHVHFLLQHPTDTSLSHPQSRWWPQWNRYTTNPVDGIMDFGPIHLCSPHTTPDPTKFVAWSTSVSLSDPLCYLSGPFDFQPRLLASDGRHILAAPHWDHLHSLCQSRGIIPPALSPITRSRWLSRSATTSRKRPRHR
jgi:hypothetical protein